jgi:hypothetical protein
MEVALMTKPTIISEPQPKKNIVTSLHRDFVTS